MKDITPKDQTCACEDIPTKEMITKEQTCEDNDVKLDIKDNIVYDIYQMDKNGEKESIIPSEDFISLLFGQLTVRDSIETLKNVFINRKMSPSGISSLIEPILKRLYGKIGIQEFNEISSLFYENGTTLKFLPVGELVTLFQCEGEKIFDTIRLKNDKIFNTISTAQFNAINIRRELSEIKR